MQSNIFTVSSQIADFRLWKGTAERTEMADGLTGIFVFYSDCKEHAEIGAPLLERQEEIQIFLSFEKPNDSFVTMPFFPQPSFPALPSLML